MHDFKPLERDGSLVALFSIMGSCWVSERYNRSNVDMGYILGSEIILPPLIKFARPRNATPRISITLPNYFAKLIWMSQKTMR